MSEPVHIQIPLGESSSITITVVEEDVSVLMEALQTDELHLIVGAALKDFASHPQ